MRRRPRCIRRIYGCTYICTWRMSIYTYTYIRIYIHIKDGKEQTREKIRTHLRHNATAAATATGRSASRSHVEAFGALRLPRTRQNVLSKATVFYESPLELAGCRRVIRRRCGAAAYHGTVQRRSRSYRTRGSRRSVDCKTKRSISPRQFSILR